MNYKFIVFSVSGLLYFLLSVTVFSQTPIFSEDTTKTPEVTLGEVVINASKDKSVLREMPSAVSLITAKELEQQEIHTLADISSTIPNLFMMDYGSKLQSPIFIRGIGSRLGIPSIGLYVDNVPHFEKTSFGFEFFDLEKIEVLRGPQGTLYGRNTMGGLINIVTKSPLTYQGTSFKLGTGNYGLFKGTVSHSQKVTDNFGFSLGVNYKEQDGYFKNVFDNTTSGDEKTISGRLKLAWRINDKLIVENTTNIEDTHQDGFPYALNHMDTLPSEVNINRPSFYEREMFSNGLVFKFDNDLVEFTSSTSYQYYDGLMSVDQDFTSRDLYFFDIGDEQKLVSQELLLKSAQDNNYNWLFGVHGFSQTMDQLTTGDIFAYEMKQEIINEFNISGFAFFHQSTIENLFVDNLTLTAGIRYDMERDRLDYKSSQSVGGSPWSSTSDTTYTENFDEFLPKVSLSYKINKQWNIYTSVAKGYKSGGFNTNSSISLDTSGNRSFDTEKSWNYEAGIKASAFENRLSMDLALFYIDWSDQQIDVPAIGGRGNMKVNAGESVSKGIEVFMRALTGFGLEGTISYGYTHATFAKYEVSESEAYTDNFIPYVPRHTFNLGLSETINLKGEILEKIIASIGYKGVGKHYWDLSNMSYQDYYGLLNAKLSLFSHGIQCDVWAKNLTDFDYNSYSFVIHNTSLQNSYIQKGLPFTFGVNVSYKF